MTSHFETGRFGRGPTEQRPRLSPTSYGGRSLRSEGRVDYESEGKHAPAGCSFLFPSTYSKSDRSDRRDLRVKNQRVTEVGFRASAGLKGPKRPVVHVRFAVPQGVICALSAPKSPRARPPGQVVGSFIRGSGAAADETTPVRAGARRPRTVPGTSYGGKRMTITGFAPPGARSGPQDPVLTLRANEWVIVAPRCRRVPPGGRTQKGGGHESCPDRRP
jgi:hypothetical protein